MIGSFKDSDVEALFKGKRGRGVLQSIERTARRKLLMIDAATTIHDLEAPPNNRLKALRGDRAGQHSIRVNDQYRICFVWDSGHAHSVEIVDYHD